MRYDVIVLGLGGMGSAAAAHLSARGQRVLGLEQFTPAHDRGSSHGESRIVRQSYFEGAEYVPLLLRAYELWHELAADDPAILTITGGLMIGSRTSTTVTGSVASARRWGLPHELLDADDLRRRFPTFAPEDDTCALYEEQAGFVRPELTVLTHLRRARARGADLRFGERALEWQAHPDGEGVTVRTDHGSYDAARLAITAGAWAPRLLRDLGVPFDVERQLLHWFLPIGGPDAVARYRAPAQPIFIWEDRPDRQLYGFPAYGPAEEGVKVAFFRAGSSTDPDQLDRAVYPAEVVEVRRWLAAHLPGLAGDHLRGVACMYTNTPDGDFVITVHPEYPQVTVAAGFSGHGFKFVPVVGEIVADLVVDGTTRHPIELFRPDRFAAGSPDPSPVGPVGQSPSDG